MPLYSILGYGDPDANSTLPSVHSSASENDNSHLEVGLDNGKMMGVVFKSAMRRTMGSGNAPNVVDRPTRAVGLTCSMTSARDANSVVVSFRIKYFLWEASFPATTSGRE